MGAGGFQWTIYEEGASWTSATRTSSSATRRSNLPNQDTPTSTPVGNLVGSYNAKVDILGVQISLHF